MDSLRTGNQALLREINLSLILDQVRRLSPISRADLAKELGLTKTTVSSLVTELQEKGYLSEQGFDTLTTPGRPSVLLQINPKAGSIISADLGTEILSAWVADFACNVLWQNKIRIRPEDQQDEILKKYIALVQEARAFGLANAGPLLGIGMGVNGYINAKTGTIINAIHLGWKNLPIRKIMTEAFSEPVYIYNASYLGALGEYHDGAARGNDNVLYISGADRGVGGAVIHKGILNGRDVVFSGRFGHIVLEPGGELCRCGNRGCWETFISRSTLFRLICRAVEGGKPSLLTGLTQGDMEKLTVTLVLEAARAGDEVTLAALRQVGYDLGRGLVSLVNALSPDIVVLGNMFSVLGDFLLPVVIEELSRHVMGWEDNPCQVSASQHGYNATLMGGIALVSQVTLPRTEPVVWQPF